MEDFLLNIFENTPIKIDSASIVKIIITLVLMTVAFIISGLIYKTIISKPNIKDDTRKRYAHKLVLRTVIVLIFIVSAIEILSAIGINPTRLSVILAIGIIVLPILKGWGFTLSLFSDLLAGFVIILDKYFVVGDAVNYNDRDGIVISFTGRTTKIEYLDDHSVISIANRNITQIRKLSHLVDVDFPISYEIPDEEATAFLSGVCEKLRKVEGIESCELKGLQDFGTSYAFYKIRFFCDPKNRPDIRREVLRIIRQSMQTADIHIPYQQIDIHEKND